MAKIVHAVMRAGVRQRCFMAPTRHRTTPPPASVCCGFTTAYSTYIPGYIYVFSHLQPICGRVRKLPHSRHIRKIASISAHADGRERRSPHRLPISKRFMMVLAECCGEFHIYFSPPPLRPIRLLGGSAVVADWICTFRCSSACVAKLYRMHPRIVEFPAMCADRH